MAERVHRNRRHQSTKPQLERQRRARINNSLDELKTLVFSALYRDADQCCQKMEKAEILEMAVSYLKMLRDHKFSGREWMNERSTDALCKYRAGFNDCTGRVMQYLKNEKDADLQLKENLLTHLASCCHFLQITSEPAAGRAKSNTQCAAMINGVDKYHGGMHYWPPTPPPSPTPSLSFCNISVVDARNRGMASCERHGFVHAEAQVLQSAPLPPAPIWRPWLSHGNVVFENITSTDN